MELRHLRYFVAVAEELHFRRAAERLYVAQPAVSEQVRKLEAELGVRLFDRTHRSVSLTTPGVALLEEARRVLHQADVAQRAARDAGRRELGRLRIGYLPDAMPPAVPKALSHFRTAAPGIEVVMETGRPLQLIDDVRQARLDMCVVSLPAPVTGLRVAPLGEDVGVAALPEPHPLSREPEIEPRRIADSSLLLLPRVANSAFHDSVISCWREAGLTASPVEVPEPHVEHLLLAAAAGGGVGVLPAAAAARHSLPGVRFVPLTPAPTTEVAAITRDDSSTSVASLMKLVRRVEQLASQAEARALTVHGSGVRETSKA